MGPGGISDGSIALLVSDLQAQVRQLEQERTQLLDDVADLSKRGAYAREERGNAAAAVAATDWPDWSEEEPSRLAAGATASVATSPAELATAAAAAAAAAAGWPSPAAATSPGSALRTETVGVGQPTPTPTLTAPTADAASVASAASGDEPALKKAGTDDADGETAAAGSAGTPTPPSTPEPVRGNMAQMVMSPARNRTPPPLVTTEEQPQQRWGSGEGAAQRLVEVASLPMLPDGTRPPMTDMLRVAISKLKQELELVKDECDELRARFV
jgi:hypothetical protein